MRLHKSFLLLALTLVSSPVMALTAVCKEPTGHMFGVIPSLGDKSEINDTDGMTGGLFTVIWNQDAETATLVTQGAGGGPPNNEVGVRILQTDDQISFIVRYEHAVWMYSLFPKVKRLLITSHSPGVLLGGAILKAYQAQCEISE